MADPLVRKFIINDNLDPNLIEIPKEFQDLSTDDVTAQNYRRGQLKKKFLRNKSNKCLTTYDAWRSFDRTLFKGGGNHPSVARILVAPADLIKAFGSPCESEVFDTATGEFNFEDNNLDCFSLFDHKETDLYHGLNREDEYYNTPENMKKAPHKRKRKYPNVQEFWESTEPHSFKLLADDQSEWRKFRRWMLLEIRKAKERTESYEEMALRKHKHELDICLGDFDEKGIVNHTSIACFKYDFTDFMTQPQLEQYIKKAQKELEDKKGEGPITKLKMPEMFDLTNAVRVYTTKEQLKAIEDAERIVEEKA